MLVSGSRCFVVVGSVYKIAIVDCRVRNTNSLILALITEIGDAVFSAGYSHPQVRAFAETEENI